MSISTAPIAPGSSLGGRLQRNGVPPRVAFYSHDTQGLGHIRRNIALAASLVDQVDGTDVVLITGNPEAARLPLPPNTDIVTLPTVMKGSDGNYRSRVLNSPLERVLDVRRKIIDATVAAFEPDLFIVDKVPRGFLGELTPTLQRLHDQTSTRVVLGLREVLDHPEQAIREWHAMESTAAVDEFYDAVWVYGDAAVYDLASEYHLPPAVRDKMTFTGYLSHGRLRSHESGKRIGSTTAADVSQDPYVLCLVGGGQDGADLARSFVRSPMPDGHRGVLLTGPFMSERHRRQLHRMQENSPEVTVHDFVAGADDLIDGAAAVVSMAGYNTVCELMAAGHPTLLVPRVTPRAEQLVRAERLAEIGVVDLITPDRSTPVALGDWMRTAVSAPLRSVQPRIDLDGLTRIPQLAAELVGRVDHAA